MSSSVESLLAGDHTSLGHLLSEIESELAARDVARSFAMLDHFWARLAVHIRAENLYLFPVITEALPRFNGRNGLPTSLEVQDVLATLRSDHDFFMKELARIIKAMRELIAGREPSAGEFEELRLGVLTVGKRLEAHNVLEEEQVYKWPLLLFDPETLNQLTKQLLQQLENRPPRFA